MPPLFSCLRVHMNRVDGAADFQLRRKNLLTHWIRAVAARLFAYHRILIDGGERLPAEGPVLLLPKHCAYRDIPLEGIVFYRVARRYGTYVMKVGLWGILEGVGGFKIIRPKDIRRIKDREQRRAEIRRARAANEQTQNYLTWLYSQGELVVSHPEGMRYQDGMGPMQREIIDHLLKAEEKLGVKIPLIPVGIEYESYWKPRGRVFFRIGEPLYSDQFEDPGDLVDTVGEQIRKLSGFA